MILDGKKTWELRGSKTSKRGLIHLALSGAGGALHGRAELVDCFAVPREKFDDHFPQHRVADIKQVPYKNIYAWVLRDVTKYPSPFWYEHPQGAVVWLQL